MSSETSIHKYRINLCSNANLSSKLGPTIAWEDLPKGVAKSFQGVDAHFLREDIKRIVQLKDEGYSVLDIGKKTGYHKEAVEWATGYAMKFVKKRIV